MPNWYTINQPTTLQYNEIQWPTAARWWHFSLRDVSHRQSCHLSTPSHPQVPLAWPYCRQAQCRCWRSLKWSIADLLTSSHPQTSASHLLGLQVHANGPSSAKSYCPNIYPVPLECLANLKILKILIILKIWTTFLIWSNPPLSPEYSITNKERKKGTIAKTSMIFILSLKGQEISEGNCGVFNHRGLKLILVLYALIPPKNQNIFFL